ncbi:MAG: glycosyltransferase family 4 protein [Anaerolineaceae bacterium]
MKITFLLTQDLNSPSSLGRFFPLAKELAKYDYEVKILALHSNYSSLKNRIQYLGGVEIRYIGQGQVLKIGNSKKYFSPIHFIYLMSIATVKFMIYALFGKFDVLYIGKPHPMNGIAGLIGKFIRRKKLIVDCDDLESSVNLTTNKLQKKILSFFETLLPLNADLVNTNTLYTFERLVKIGVIEERIYLLPNGIDRSRFSNQNWTYSEKIKRELNIHGKIVIGYIGTISLISHPVEILVEAFASLYQKFPTIHLLLVGGGEDIPYIKRRITELGISNIVSFVGRINSEDIPQYYKACDITVDPVLNNDVAKARLPLKMFESWVVGIPFVTSNVGDRKIYLSNPISGLCAEGDSSFDLENEIVKLLTDTKLRNEIISNGIKKSENFYWDIITMEYQKFLGEKFNAC